MKAFLGLELATIGASIANKFLIMTSSRHLKDWGNMKTFKSLLLFGALWGVLWCSHTIAQSAPVGNPPQIIPELNEIDIKVFRNSFLLDRRVIQLFIENLRSEEGLTNNESISVADYFRLRPGLFMVESLRRQLNDLELKTPFRKLTSDVCLIEPLSHRNIEYHSHGCSVLFRFRDEEYYRKKKVDSREDFAEFKNTSDPKSPAEICQNVIERLNTNLPLCEKR